MDAGFRRHDGGRAVGQGLRSECGAKKSRLVRRFGDVALAGGGDRKDGVWRPALPGLSTAQSRVIFDGWFEKGDSRFRGNDGGFAGMTSERFWA